MPTDALGVLDVSPVIPVVAVDDPTTAVPMARALARGGVRVVEITLRTPAALEAIRRLAAEVPEMLTGAGTVTSPAQAAQAAAAGARFLVSPGSTDRLLGAMTDTDLPLLPGVATVGEMLRMTERGISTMKLFPAVAVGGAALLRAVAGPLPDLRFCPTGGITPQMAPQFLRLPNVRCVGGSWLTSPDLLAAQDWHRVEALARASSLLASDRD